MPVSCHGSSPPRFCIAPSWSRKRESLKSWTILLAILAFGFSLIGTFIVRSGVITSVHAFANDPERGVFILLILGLFMGGAFLLFALRAGAMEAKGVFGLVSRESALVVNNLLLVVSCIVVFIGTIWPLLAEMFLDRTLSVGPPFFNAAFNPFVLLLAAILPIGAMLPWKRAKIGRVLRALLPAAALAVAGALLAYAIATGRSALGPVFIGLAVWLVAGAVVDLIGRTGRGAIRDRLGRLARLPRADWGKAVGHAGFGLTLFGIAALTTFESEDIRVARIGEAFTVGDYEITLTEVREVEGPNYISLMGSVEVVDNGRPLAILHPERRFYPVAGMPTTEAAIDGGITRDVYIVLGEAQQGGFALRTYIKPWANWIWGGAIIMALGGAPVPVGPAVSGRRRGKAPSAPIPKGCPRNETAPAGPAAAGVAALGGAARRDAR